jgi:histidyl-tRNA synthetase
MAQNITSIKGVNDVLAPEIHLWHRLEDAARRIFPRYGYTEIRTPIFERTELFTRSIGTETDVVSKEMYTFDDEGTSLTLRPEGTASVVRAFVEKGLHVSANRSRLWYLGPMFRRERAQRGRYRQFWQIGAEMFGETSPRSDAEVLAMLRDFLDDVAVRDVDFEISSLGDGTCRTPYKADLQTFLRTVATQLCEDCQKRIEKNPLRVLDCKKPACRAATANAPLLLGRLCEPCKAHFEEVRRNLDLLGVRYVVNPRIVRGLDYYVRTAFELIHRPGDALLSPELVTKIAALPETDPWAKRLRERLGADGRLRIDEAFLDELRLGAREKGEVPRLLDKIVEDSGLGTQNAVGGGGRYDGLVKELGGGPVAGIGFGLGVERLVLVLKAQGTRPKTPPIAWIAALGPEAQDAGMKLARDLRGLGVLAQIGYDAKPKELKQEMEAAKKRGAQAVIIIGPDELAKRVAQVKDLPDGRQQIEERLDAAALAAVLARIT